MALLYKIQLIFIWMNLITVKSYNKYFGDSISFTDQIANNFTALAFGAHVCPFMDFCTREQRINSSLFVFSSRVKPCCTACSCETNCRYHRNCCIDAEWSVDSYDEEVFNHLSCSSIYLQNERKHKLARLVKETKYTMVSTCPQSDGTFAPCSSFVNGTRTVNDVINDIVLVSTQDGRIIFKNEHCARCHNVIDFVRWVPSVARCKDNLFTLGLSQHDLLTYVVENCVVFSEPPVRTSINTDAFLCDEKDFWISECNVTGQWDIYVPEIEQLCLSSQYTPVYQSPREAYSNVFCMLCNKPEGSDFRYICTDSGNIVISLGYILNLELFSSSSLEQKSSDQTSYGCLEDEIVDPYFNICRQYKCPFQRMPKHGVCNDHHFDSKHIYFALSFKLSFVNNTTLLMPLFHGQELFDVKEFLGHFNITSCNYLLTEAEFYFSKNSNYLEYLHLKIYLHKTSTCREGVLYILLYEYNSTDSFPLRLFGQTVHGIPEVIIPVSKTSNNGSAYKSFPLVDKYNTAIFSYYDNSFYNSPAYRGPSEGMPCPHIILNHEEYLMISSDTTKRSFIEQSINNVPFFDEMLHKFVKRMYYVGKRIEFLYFICLEDYLPTKPAQTNSVRLDSIFIDKKGILSLILTCLSMLSIVVCIVLFCLTGKVNSVPSKIFVCALINIFVAQGLFQFGVDKIDAPFYFCVLIGGLVHFFWLSTNFALNAYCVLVAINLVSIDSIRTFKSGEMVKSVLYVFGLPCVFVLINVLYTWLAEGQIGYGEKLCYIDMALMRALSFALPIFLTVIMNCFVNTYLILKTMKTAKNAGRRFRETKYAIVYFRLMLLSGIAWLFGLLNEIYSSEILEYCFIITVAGQGTFLLVAFYFDKVAKCVRKTIRSNTLIHESHTPMTSQR